MSLTTEQKNDLVEFLIAREEALIHRMDEQIARALAPIKEHAVFYGQYLALKADRGLYVGVQEGGPGEPDQPIALVSKAEIGPWESFVCFRGKAD